MYTVYTCNAMADIVTLRYLFVRKNNTWKFMPYENNNNIVFMMEKFTEQIYGSLHNSRSVYGTTKKTTSLSTSRILTWICETYYLSLIHI